ncbi:MAG TPA: DsbA family oxidoreductase, partial [Hyphomicrobiales bacterium]|nr:DsbA family oxidoreductase [Hyphomicrobiales bacterium]
MSDEKKTVRVEVVSDAVCPWCWIGKRRLEAAETILRDRYTIDAVWKPFELNPGIPAEGLPRDEYRKLKFGSLDYSRRLDHQVADAGKAAGLEFRHELMKWTPNTIECHRLIWLAGREGKQDDLVEHLFRAYFHDGKNIGERNVMLEAAEAAGIDRGEAERFLDSDEGRSEVMHELERARQSGISGVPTFMVNG